MMALLWVALILTPVLYFLWNLPYYKRRYEKLKAFPHPPEHFLFGHCLKINNPFDMAKNLIEWTKTYGSIFKLTIGHVVLYVVSDPGLLEFLTTKSDYVIIGRVYESFQPWLGEGLGMVDGERWKKRRNMIGPTFNYKILEGFLEIFNKNIDILLQKFKKVADSPSFDIRRYVTGCSLDIICETAMGVSLCTEEKKNIEYRKAIENIQNLSVSNIFSVIKPNNFLFYFTRTYWDLKKNLKIAHGFTKEIIETKRKEKEKRQIKPCSDKDDVGVKRKKILLDFLVEAEIDGRPLNDLEIRQEVDIFLNAGHESSSTTICFTLYCLSLHPEVQRKAFEEVNSILESDKERRVTYGDCHEMKYLDLVVKETMRIYTSVPIVGREIAQEFQYGGYTFLKGSFIGLHFHGAHMDPKNFKNPEVFNPERWLEDAPESRNMFSYLPFSAGPRNCPGQKFALLEIKTMVAKILMNYEVLPPEQPCQLKLIYEIVLKPVDTMMLRFKTRDI